MVRWPTRASSRTPLSAISAAATWACVASICALAASSWPHAWVTVRLHLIARGVEVEPALSERLLGLPDGRVFAAALIDAGP